MADFFGGDWFKAFNEEVMRRGGMVAPKEEDQIPDRDRRIANRIRVNNYILAQLRGK